MHNVVTTAQTMSKGYFFCRFASGKTLILLDKHILTGHILIHSRSLMFQFYQFPVNMSAWYVL